MLPVTEKHQDLLVFVCLGGGRESGRDEMPWEILVSGSQSRDAPHVSHHRGFSLPPGRSFCIEKLYPSFCYCEVAR
jgi:hypothetical protein